MIKTTLTAASLAVAAIATPAFAGPAELPTKEVSFSDLDLSTAAGQAALDRRIDTAARKVCHMDNMRTVSRIKSRERQECYDKARASAANQIAAIVEEKQLGG